MPSCDVTARHRRDHVNRLVGQTLLIDGSGFLLMNNFQSLWMFMLIFTVIVVYFCDRVDFHRVYFGVNHMKDVV